MGNSINHFKRKLYKCCLLASIFAMCSSAPLWAQTTLRVGMPMPGQVPFLWENKAGEVTGIYADTLREIANKMQFKIEYVPLSQARLARLFMAGEIDLEIGVSAQTKEDNLLAKASIFTRSFGIANEVMVYSPDLHFPAFILKDLKGKTVATVRGAVVPDYIVRENFASPLQIAKRVNRGWSQVGLMREAPALHYKTNQGMKYQISLPYQSNLIGFRLHKSRSGLLQKMNVTIEELESKGVLEEIICKYLCGS